MKRVGHLYENMCNLDFIRAAIHNAAKGKTDRPHIRKILDNIDHYAQEIKTALETETIELSPNEIREIYDHSCRKTRTITIPKFYPDQIVHWLLITAIQPVIMRGMYRYCCGSIPNRGGIDAKAFVETAIRDEKMRYVAKLDISKFFDSVRPSVVIEMLKRKIKDEKVIRLAAKILANGGEHLPIGYYTSQWLSNFVLEGLDHYIKEVLRIKYYVRYVDDMVLIDSNKRKLHRAVTAIDEYLHGIGLKLKGNWQIWKLHSRPIDFVGYRFYKNKTLLRKRIFFRLCRRTRAVKKAGYITPRQAMSILSLVGWLSHINAHGFYKKNIYPYAPKNKLKKIVSNYSKKQNSEVFKNGRNSRNRRKENRTGFQQGGVAQIGERAKGAGNAQRPRNQ